MIRILFVTSARLSLRRAHTRNIIKTASSLAKDGFAVCILTKAKEPDIERVLIMHGVENILMPSNVISGSLLYTLVRLRHSFDVLYFRDPKLIILAFLARFFLRKKVIFEIHGNKEWKFLLPLWLSAHRLSHGVVFITKRLAEWYGRTRPSIVVHMNAPDIELFKKNYTAKNILREELHLSQYAFILMYTGSALWNRVEVLVRGLTFLPNECFLVLVGLKEEEESIIRQQAQKLGVEERLIIKQRVDPVDIPKYLMAADVLLVPPGSIAYEGSMASKIFDYLASGVPIISHVHGANREILTDMENALIVETDRPEDFAHAIGRLRDNPRLAQEIAENARKDAGRFTWEARAKTIGKFIITICRRPNI